MSAIDPGVEDGIKESADDVEPDKEGADYDRDESRSLQQPSRWWFASTACPLLAGTFGPMASGFNICALVQYWRQTIPPEPNDAEVLGHKIEDPEWVLIVNIFSLAAAVIGNAALLLNMARRVRFSIAQPTTITGFLTAGILLIADTATLSSQPAYGLTKETLLPPSRHALTQAFYYAIFAAVIYTILGLLMCVTVYGANKGHYSKDFHLTGSQRTLMLQTMSFITYLMLGALVFGYIEEWEYLDAVYWADVTLLTVGLGDYHPTKALTRGLMFPFAFGGILMVGLVVGSIRSLILERGKEKLSARIVEKKRFYAVHNVDNRKQTIKVSMFAKVDFSTDPALSPAQKREEEFNVMRKVQKAAERERRYFALSLSSTFALILWFVGAAVFQQTEFQQEWTYLQALYFSYTSLLTIGYGDFAPYSNSGRAFFVLWSLLAVPSLTILISNMGDTVIKWFSDLTIWIGSITVLPGEEGLRASTRAAARTLTSWMNDSIKSFTPPGILGAAPAEPEQRLERSDYENKMLDNLAERLGRHTGDRHVDFVSESEKEQDTMTKDIQFYHYVLARECRNVQKDLSASPPKEYTWQDWEYFLKLMGNEDDPADFPGQQHPDILVPEAVRAPKFMMVGEPSTHLTPDSRGSDEKATSSSDEPQKPDEMDGNIDRKTSVMRQMTAKRKQFRNRKGRRPDDDFLMSWSWLSQDSPLMSQKSEAEWVLERLSAALERELNRQRKGFRVQPPIGLRDARKRNKMAGNKEGGEDGAEDAAQEREQDALEKAEKSEE
ncbi:uncharacterized protein LTR77_010695 [Saxophila tyrrhenica]|uniref:Potassium channel domain-containing protein n=1 Tax=Saxophila tyrrhenica TaxID=1690608 RepID=A0AAV9NY34_9PEZI|nr:hypothetical protein LTR77_010695 [Saxophila tyrrhenica]